MCLLAHWTKNTIGKKKHQMANATTCTVCAWNGMTWKKCSLLHIYLSFPHFIMLTIWNDVLCAHHTPQCDRKREQKKKKKAAKWIKSATWHRSIDSIAIVVAGRVSGQSQPNIAYWLRSFGDIVWFRIFARRDRPNTGHHPSLSRAF